MGTSIEAGLTEAERQEQGLQVLARMIARAYARDYGLAPKLETKDSIPKGIKTSVGHARGGKVGLEKSIQ